MWPDRSAKWKLSFQRHLNWPIGGRSKLHGNPSQIKIDYYSLLIPQPQLANCARIGKFGRRLLALARVILSLTMESPTPGVSGEAPDNPFHVCRKLAEDHYWVVGRAKLPLWALFYTATGLLYIVLLSLAGYVQIMTCRCYFI